MGKAAAQHNLLMRMCWLAVLAIAYVSLVQGLAFAQDNSGGSWQTGLNGQKPDTQFSLQGSINPSLAFVSQVAWVDNDRFLSLAITPEGAEVWRTSYEFPRPERFMSQKFLTQNICPPEYIHSLKFQVSPGKNYIFFSWQGRGDVLAHALVDISRAPSFRLKRFSLPPGMQVAFASFSPDDSLIVLGHDSFRQDCGISLLTINLTTGTENWRMKSHRLNFVSNLWWSNPANGANKLFASAKVFEGNFAERTSFFTIDPQNGEVAANAELDGVIIGAEALWGRTWVSETTPGTEFPFSLTAEIPGAAVQLQVPLSSPVVDMQVLSDPGRVLVSNSSDGSITQLWLVDLASGDKFRVDEDCAEFSLSPNDTLLVRGSRVNQLRVYKLEVPGSRPSTPIYTETGDSVGVGE